jgi:Predicted transcriptional regulators
MKDKAKMTSRKYLRLVILACMGGTVPPRLFLATIKIIFFGDNFTSTALIILAARVIIIFEYTNIQMFWWCDRVDIDREKNTELADLLKALAHPVRLCIVRGLVENGGCNVSHMQSCLDVPQSTISQHLQKLRAAGIIRGVRNGLEVNYQIADHRIPPLIRILFADESKGGN